MVMERNGFIVIITMGFMLILMNLSIVYSLQEDNGAIIYAGMMYLCFIPFFHFNKKWKNIKIESG